jgi:hypothetical protein
VDVLTSGPAPLLNNSKAEERSGVRLRNLCCGQQRWDLLIRGAARIRDLRDLETVNDCCEEHSIPGTISRTLVLDEAGKDFMPYHNGYLEEYADLLRAQRIKVADQASAALVRSRLLRSTGLEWPPPTRGTETRSGCWDTRSGRFGPLHQTRRCGSSSYYRLSVDADGVVLSGRLLTDVLKRRKLEADRPKQSLPSRTTALL